MSTPALKISNLRKVYRRGTVAVEDLSLTIEEGEFFGFLGPNGAGKTTTFRMIAGILRPTSGTVEIGGIDVAQRPLEAKSRLGFIPDRPFVYDKLTGGEFLRFAAALYGQQGPSVERRIDELRGLHEVDAVGARHLQVRQQQVEAALAHGGQGVCGGGVAVSPISLVFQRVAQCAHRRRLVVNDEQCQLVGGFDGGVGVHGNVCKSFGYIT